MEKDITWRDYFEDNCRYADIINGLGCAGIQLVSPEDLTELVSNEDYYQNVDNDAYEVIAKYANTKGIINLENYKNPEGGIDMCKGLKDIITDSKAEGRAEGRAEAFVHAYQKLKQPKINAINALMDEYHIIKEDAIQLVEKYWQ